VDDPEWKLFHPPALEQKWVRGDRTPRVARSPAPAAMPIRRESPANRNDRDRRTGRSRAPTRFSRDIVDARPGDTNVDDRPRVCRSAAGDAGGWRQRRGGRRRNIGSTFLSLFENAWTLMSIGAIRVRCSPAGLPAKTASDQLGLGVVLAEQRCARRRRDDDSQRTPSRP
jgi:hypothetical protein